MDYDIKVPRSMNVTIKATNGEIDVKAITGMVQVEAVERRDHGRSAPKGADVITANGRVVLDFAKIGATACACETTNGQIDRDRARRRQGHVCRAGHERRDRSGKPAI